MGLSKYSPDEWQLFIANSKRTSKCIQFDNSIQIGSIPTRQCISMKEESQTISLVLKKIKYEEHVSNLCRFKYRKLSVWEAKWIHKTSLFLM